MEIEPQPHAEQTSFSFHRPEQADTSPGFVNLDPTLLKAFEVLAESPDGVRRLRELVLQLAVRGKLVRQDLADEPAATLLGTGVKLVKDEDVPFALPAGWAWTSLELVGETRGGGTPSKQNHSYWGGSIPWVSPKDMKRDFIGESQDYITHAALDSSAVKVIPPASLLMVVRGMILAHSFPTALTTAEVTVNQDMKALLPFNIEMAPYLLVATKGLKPEVLSLVERSTHGTCKLSTDKLFVLPIPVPPLSEQHRIVAKVDELMGLIDRLEAARDAREGTRVALRDAALAALRNADTPDEVQVAWQRVSEGMDDLFIDPTDVNPLRQAVLQLAVRGRLVAQDPGDEPASVLLERIEVEKDRLVKAGKIRKQKLVPPVSADEVRFDAPEGWAWCRTQDIVTLLDPNPSHRYPNYVPHGVPLLSTREFDGVEGWNTKTAAKTVPEDFWAFQRDLCDFQPSDIVIARKGRLGLARTVPEHGRYTFSHTVFVVKIHSDVAARCVLWFLRPDSVVEWLLAEMNSNTGVPTLGKAVLERMPIPVPPVLEQHRIVAKVEELMGLLDQLEQRLVAQRNLHDAFAAAAVHDIDA